MSTMVRIGRGIAAMLAVSAIAVSGAGVASAASAAPNSQDASYVTTNGQTNLAEITLGQLALQRAQNDETRELAQMTLTDHQAALTKLQAVAAQLGVPVPTEPSADQKKDAATLEAVSDDAFDVTYAQIQVAGHQKSIAGTNQEISAGSDPALLDYAKGYLPVATMHLQMAQDALAASGGTPAAVPAGSGGLAASTAPSTLWWQSLSVLAAVLLIGAGLFVVRRRSSVH